MPFTVRFNDQNPAFIVEDQETVLDAALRQNYDFPHSCCEGICGTCSGQIIEGHVWYSTPEHLDLNEEEQKKGIALFCSAFPQSDLLISVPGLIPPPSKPPVLLPYETIELNLLSKDIYQVILRPSEQGFDYLPGQYIEIHLPNQEAKAFSIAKAPSNNQTLELHIRGQENNFYAQNLIQCLKTDQKINLSGPFGHCFYHNTPKQNSIMIAVGTGFAPLKAILETALPVSSEPISLFWGGKSLDDFYQLELLKKWKSDYPLFSFYCVLNQTKVPDGWHGEQGDLLNCVIKNHPSLKNHHIYISGAPELTYEALSVFEKHDAEIAYIYSDAFDL